VLTAAGRWPEADAALTEAVRLWGLGFGSMRDGALARLADLRVRQGRFEEAERLLDGLDANPDTAHALAAIHLARGDTTLATDVLERALDEVDPATAAAVPLLAALLEVHLVAGAWDEANTVAEAIAVCASGATSDYLVAVAALARARICLAAGTGDPNACLREALAAFSRAQMPMEIARCRLELARAMMADRPEVAIAEARTALQAFERLQAGRDIDAAAAFLRGLGVRPPSVGKGDGALTKREAEVLTLLGLGLSNPEIADRLYISRKTVEHHVGNILAKLGLRSRAEAAAYAVREKPAVE
jgi:DNA-binding NarL/FixJ family response regulator